MSHDPHDLPQRPFDTLASFAAMQLDQMGFTYVRLTPGDATAYEFSIIRPPTGEQWNRWLDNRWRDEPLPLEFNDDNRYFVATQFGPLYGWNGGYVHESYAIEKYCDRSRPAAPWTAVVIARFLSALGEAITDRRKEAE